MLNRSEVVMWTLCIYANESWPGRDRRARLHARVSDSFAILGARPRQESRACLRCGNPCDTLRTAARRGASSSAVGGYVVDLSSSSSSSSIAPSPLFGFRGRYSTNDSSLAHVDRRALERARTLDALWKFETLKENSRDLCRQN